MSSNHSSFLARPIWKFISFFQNEHYIISLVLTCSEASLLLAVAKITVSVVLHPPLFFPLQVGVPQAPHRPCRWFTPALPFDHVGDATLGHSSGLGHLVLHGAGHTYNRYGGAAHTHTFPLSNQRLASVIEDASTWGPRGESRMKVRSCVMVSETVLIHDIALSDSHGVRTLWYGCIQRVAMIIWQQLEGFTFSWSKNVHQQTFNLLYNRSLVDLGAFLLQQQQH